MESQVWFITAASGVGLALAKHLLEQGECVAGTSRSKARLESILGKESKRFLPLELAFQGDMQAQMAKVIRSVYEKF